MKVLLTGGGTGGHIYPALALKRQMEKEYPDAEFLYVGTHNGLESKIVPENNVPFQSIEIQGFRRSFSKYNIKTIVLFIKAISESKRIIAEFQPDVVIGTGGYVCGPVVYAAAKMGIPSVIHEQNSVAGLTNKFLAHYVDKIAICFDEADSQFGKNQHKVVYTGNPRAQEVSHIKPGNSLESFDLDSNKPTVLIFGGSRGAARINKALMDAAPQLINKKYQVLAVTGEFYYDEVASKVGEEMMKKTKTFKIAPYIPNMPEVFADVSLVVCRSGATTLSEVTSMGLPTLLIPSPNVTDDHQTKNAMSLVNKGAAEMLAETELNGETLEKEIDRLMTNNKKRADMSQAAKQAGVPDAADRVIEVLLDAISHG